MKLEDWLDIRELVLMSVGTDKGRWWADPEFGSELWVLRQTGKVSGETVGNVRRMILESLEWLKDDGLASKIECSARQVGKFRIEYTVTVIKSDGSETLIKEVWNATQS